MKLSCTHQVNETPWNGNNNNDQEKKRINAIDELQLFRTLLINAEWSNELSKINFNEKGNHRLNLMIDTNLTDVPHQYYRNITRHEYKNPSQQHEIKMRWDHATSINEWLSNDIQRMVFTDWNAMRTNLPSRT